MKAPPSLLGTAETVSELPDEAAAEGVVGDLAGERSIIGQRDHRLRCNRDIDPALQGRGILVERRTGDREALAVAFERHRIERRQAVESMLPTDIGARRDGPSAAHRPRIDRNARAQRRVGDVVMRAAAGKRRKPARLGKAASFDIYVGQIGIGLKRKAIPRDVVSCIAEELGRARGLAAVLCLRQEADIARDVRVAPGLTDILYQRDGDYSIAAVPSRWDNGGAKVCGAGGRYRRDECGLTVL